MFNNEKDALYTFCNTLILLSILLFYLKITEREIQPAGSF